MAEKTLVHDTDPDLTREDALEYLGKDGIQKFYTARHLNQQRVGQSWFNALTREDQRKLMASWFNCFYKDDWKSVIQALAFLLEN